MADTNDPHKPSDDWEFFRRVFVYLERCIAPQDYRVLTDELQTNGSKRRMLVSICLARTALREKARMEYERDRHSSDDQGPPDLQQLILLSGLESDAPPADLPVRPHKAMKPALRSQSKVSLSLFSPLWKWSIAAGILIVVTIGIVVSQMSRSAQGPTVLRVVGAQLDSSATALTPTTVLSAGPHSLSKGLLELKLAGGATVALEGPAQFEVQSKNAVSLTAGRLSASVPHGGSGLDVQTPDAVTIDLGTEFGVAVEPGASTHVEVFEGRVRVEVHAKDGTTAQQTVSAQRAVVITSGASSIQPAQVMPLSFVRPGEIADRSVAAADESGYSRWEAFSKQLRADPDLIAYYPFENEDEPGATVNRALATQGRYDGVFSTGPLASSPIRSQGRWSGKRGLQFGAAGPTALTIRGDANLVPTDAFSIAVWFKWLDSKASAPLLNSTVNRKKTQLSLCLNGTKTQLLFGKPLTVDFAWSGARSQVTSPPILPSDQRWCFLVITAAAHEQTQFYVDGKPVGSQPSAPVTNVGAADLSVGAPSPGGQDVPGAHGFFRGWMDELALFHRVLSGEEVRRMHEAGTPG